MAEQYLRTCTLAVEGGGKTLDLSQMRIRFATRQRDTSTPHVLNAIVSNVSRQTAEMIRKEYKTVSLSAGYRSGSGLIFKGEILQVRSGRENVADSYVHILATSSERARNFATVNKTLAAGHTFRDRVDVATQAMKQYGITIGHIDQLDPRKFPRAFAAFGMAKDLLRDVCFSTGSSWHNHNGTFHLVKNSGTLPGDTVVLNSNTGMVGLPEQTLQGVIVRCLLNYRIRPAQKLQINESSIQRASLDPAYTGGLGNYNLSDAGILGVAADGIYKALLVEHSGDTRGPDWYTDITCVKADGGESPALRARGISDTEAD